MKASLKNHRQAPRKMRVIVNALRGKTVAEALVLLTFMPQKATQALEKLVRSAYANAKDKDASVTETGLYIQTITVDKGITFVRFMPRAMGRAAPINRECSHVRIQLARKEGAVSTEKPAATKETAPRKKVVKKAATKAK